MISWFLKICFSHFNLYRYVTEWLHWKWNKGELSYQANRKPNVQEVQVHPIHDQTNFLTKHDLAALLKDTGGAVRVQ